MIVARPTDLRAWREGSGACPSFLSAPDRSVTMENIIPRWEWRTFRETFGESDDRFAALEPGGVQESDELYLLSPSTDENVKIRDLLMDIKTLEQVNPVLRAGWLGAGASGAAQYRRTARVRLLSQLRSHRERHAGDACPSGRTTLANRAML